LNLISNYDNYDLYFSFNTLACGGILKEPSGIILSPKNPEKYLHRQMCKWVISVNESNLIQINWISFSLDDRLTCDNDYVEVYDNRVQGNSSKIAR